MKIGSFADVKASKDRFLEATAAIHRETNPLNARTIVQMHDRRAVVQTPPCLPVRTERLDWYFSLPYQRRPHPRIRPITCGSIPATRCRISTPSSSWSASPSTAGSCWTTGVSAGSLSENEVNPASYAAKTARRAVSDRRVEEGAEGAGHPRRVLLAHAHPEAQPDGGVPVRRGAQDAVHDARVAPVDQRDRGAGREALEDEPRAQHGEVDPARQARGGGRRRQCAQAVHAVVATGLPVTVNSDLRSSSVNLIPPPTK